MIPSCHYLVNIPIHSSYIVEVDGEKIGLMKAGETKYFDIEENAATLLVKMQGAKSNSVDISENAHHSLVINSKKQILNNLLFTLWHQLLRKITIAISRDDSNSFSIFNIYSLQKNQI